MMMTMTMRMTVTIGDPDSMLVVPGGKKKGQEPAAGLLAAAETPFPLGMLGKLYPPRFLHPTSCPLGIAQADVQPFWF